jgi:hypothetical protein
VSRDRAGLLFDLPSAGPLPAALSPSVYTPLGEMRFLAAVGAALPEPADEVHQVGDDARLFSWDLAECRVELLICRPVIDLPRGLAVADRWAAMWRVRATDATGPLSFSCSWSPLARWREGGAETGQHLEAMTWTDGVTRVTAGTADGELLFARAAAGDLLPPRWATPRVWGGRPAEELDVARYSADGLAVELPPLLPGERCQVHFTLAWAPESADAATWFAADLQPEAVLAGVT